MFDKFRRSLEDVLNGARSPDERREAVARMKETLTLARVGLDDLRTGVRDARRRLEAERRELETVRRRKGLAAGIGDAETVAVAERYERQHAERVAVLTRKAEAQESELALAEEEVAAMGRELQAALRGGSMGGAPGGARSGVSGGSSPAAGGGGETGSGARGAPDAQGVDGSTPDDDQALDALAALARSRRRAAREAAAEERLADLKRRMGK